jgi:hypothetical protein
MSTYIHRSIEPVLKEMAGQFPAVAVTGPRQSGKSTLLQQVFPDYAYLTLDDPLVLQQALQDPELLLESAGSRVVIDEIQYAPQLLPYIKTAIDLDRQPGQWILTGSQQWALMKGISETLAGRIAILHLFPFSLEEVQKILNAHTNIKHRALLMITYSSGLRVSETRHLKISDIDSSRMLVRVEQAKGHRDRYAVLSPIALDLLRVYWKVYKPKYWLFENKDGHPVPESTAQQIFKNALENEFETNNNFADFIGDGSGLSNIVINNTTDTSVIFSLIRFLYILYIITNKFLLYI